MYDVDDAKVIFNHDASDRSLDSSNLQYRLQTDLL
jgi:hypothetical protein